MGEVEDLTERRRAQWRAAKQREKRRKLGLEEPWVPRGADLEGHGERMEYGTPPGCLVWMGARLPNGYGRVWRDGKAKLVHRVALEDKLERELGEGMLACHTCDNPPCFEKEHLFEGTPQDNMDDMTEKGRHYWQWVARERAKKEATG